MNPSDTISTPPEQTSSCTDAAELIATPNRFDILCGQSKQCFEWEGSRRYRLVIDSYSSKYAAAGSRLEKMAVTMEIYDLLQKSKSRFLRYKEAQAAWEEIPFLGVRDKIGHALRFANRATKRRPKKAGENQVKGSAAKKSTDSGVAAASAPTPAPVLSSSSSSDRNPFSAQQQQTCLGGMMTMMDFQRQAHVRSQKNQVKAARALHKQVSAAIAARNLAARLPANRQAKQAKLKEATVTQVSSTVSAVAAIPQAAEPKQERTTVIKPKPRTPKNLAFAASLRALQQQQQKKAAAINVAAQDKSLKTPNEANVATNNSTKASETGLLRPTPPLPTGISMENRRDNLEAAKNQLIQAFHKSAKEPTDALPLGDVQEDGAAQPAPTKKRKRCPCDVSPPLPTNIIIGHSGADEMVTDKTAPSPRKRCCTSPAPSSSSVSGAEPWSILQESLEDWESDHSSFDDHEVTMELVPNDPHTMGVVALQ
ncbi:expressed unknown protein [Seminavis robusta]|uniref:DUF6824 domain-containing protein n=1 Tax=Seminavis robusta TaxID=568900 RepID=A0A9N8E5M9_9STRA|nr:expressed unknown protein [Seminavis robusta]|eukprot:Sro574_g169200.1 n/a (482) ;mRNA; f:30705-32222